MYKIKVNTYGSIEALLLFDEIESILTTDDIKKLGLYWLNAYPDLNVELDLVGSWELINGSICLFDVSVGINGNFVFIEPPKHLKDQLISKIKEYIESSEFIKEYEPDFDL